MYVLIVSISLLGVQMQIVKSKSAPRLSTGGVKENVASLHTTQLRSRDATFLLTCPVIMTFRS